MQSTSTMLCSCRKNTKTTIKNFSIPMSTLPGSQKPPAARFASISITMRNSVQQPQSVSMQSGTILLRSSKSVTNNLEISVSTRARQAVEFGEVRICAMEYSVEHTMSACQNVVALSSRLLTTDVSQCLEIIAQAWTHLEQSTLTKITTGTSRMIQYRMGRKRL